MCLISGTINISFNHIPSSSNMVESVLKDYRIGHENTVSQDRWSLVTGSVPLKCETFWQEYVVLQDRWSLMAVVSQDGFHCSTYNDI